MSTESGRVCPLCDATARKREAGPRLIRGQAVARVYVDCPRCGLFTTTGDTIEYLAIDPTTRAQRYLISAKCRNWGGAEIPDILTSTLQSFIQEAPRHSVMEALDRLLLHVAKTTPRLNDGSTFACEYDYPLFAFRDTTDAMSHCYLLRDEGWIREIKANTPFSLTVKGWERVAELQKSGPNSRFVFVAMNFDKTYAALYDEVLAPAIREAKYEPIRVDRTEYTHRIDDEIVAQIRRSRFAVADFSGQKYGVYFEAGFVMGLGRRVIWTCEESEIDANKLHFDIRQYNFIPWKANNFDDACKRLVNRIVALEGEGS